LCADGIDNRQQRHPVKGEFVIVRDLVHPLAPKPWRGF